MPHRAKAVTFDVDPDSLVRLRQAFPGWEVEAVHGASTGSLTRDWSPGAGYEAGKELLGQPDVTAVFVANDQMALGLLRALHEAGRSVPQEMSVVGFDDIPEAQFFTPPLTTIRQDFGELGRRGVRLLLRAMAQGTQRAQEPPVMPELIVRSSTAVAAGTGALPV